MDALNLTLTRVSDWLLGLTAAWPPVATLLLWSAVAGVLMTIVFRYTSNQQALKTAADRGRAQVLAINLFGHELHAIFGGLGQLFKHTGLRLWYSLPPMLVMLVPFVLVLTQLSLWYDRVPLEPGQSAVVKLELAEDAWPQRQGSSLEASDDILVETPALRDAEQHTIYWRISPQSTAAARIVWQVGDEEIEKRLQVDDSSGRLVPVSSRRPGRGFWDRMMNPAEPALPAGSQVRGIEIDYPPRATPVFGFEIPWWLTFLLGSIVAALLARPLLRTRF